MSVSSHPQIAILILAAGTSKRMGSPKQLLKWGDSTLLNHSIEQAITSKANEVFVVLGANYSKIKNSINYPSITILKNDDWKDGMGNSIAFGINKIQHMNFGGVLIILVDQPQVDTGFINKLIEEFTKNEYPIITTRYKNTIGVPAIFDKSFFNQLALLTGDKGAKGLIQKHPNKTSALAPRVTIEDIDTLHVYEKLLSNEYKK